MNSWTKYAPILRFQSAGNEAVSRAFFNSHGSDSVASASTGRPRRAGLAAFEDGIRQHQDRDQRQQEDGVGRLVLAEPGRHRVPRGLENPASNGRYDDSDEDDGREVIAKYVVDMAKRRWQFQQTWVIRNSQREYEHGPAEQHNKARKNENMQDARASIARLPPLSQPEFQHQPKARERLVEPQVALGAKQGREAANYDVDETADAQKMQEQEQGPAPEQKEGGLRDGINVRHYDVLNPLLVCSLIAVRGLQPRPVWRLRYLFPLIRPAITPLERFECRPRTSTGCRFNSAESKHCQRAFDCRSFIQNESAKHPKVVQYAPALVHVATQTFELEQRERQPLRPSRRPIP